MSTKRGTASSRARSQRIAPRRSSSAAARPAGRTCRGSARRRECGRVRPVPPPRSSMSGNSRYGFCESDDEILRARRAVADARLVGVRRARAGASSRARSKRQGSAASSSRKLIASPRKPSRGGQRMISPRSVVRTTVCVKWLIATYSAKKRSSAAPIRNAPEPSNALSSISTVISTPARRRRRPAACGCGARSACACRLRTPRMRRSVAPSARSANSISVSRSATAPSSAPRSTRPRWLRLSMLMSRQATSPVEAVSVLPTIAVIGGSRGRVGPARQRISSVTSSSSRKSAPPSPTGRRSARCRLVHSARTLSSATRCASSGSARSPSDRNISVPV